VSLLCRFAIPPNGFDVILLHALSEAMLIPKLVLGFCVSSASSVEEREDPRFG
jgi:hypothetical protein